MSGVARKQGDVAMAAAETPGGSGAAWMVRLSSNAAFLCARVFQVQSSVESARRYYPTLRKWAETKKVYQERTFSKGEVEEAILAWEQHSTIAPSPGPEGKGVAAAAGDPAEDAKKKPSSSADCWWPRWAIDKKRGVEVWAPALRGKPAAWAHATPVAIGYHGQKRRFLFVRSPNFEMDCRRSEVRLPGGGKTAEDLAKEMVARGDDPVRHPDWTDGTDVAQEGKRSSLTELFTPTVAEPGSSSASSAPASGAIFEELEGDFERMALLRRSPLIKTRTCDHPDPLAEPRAAASIQVPLLTAQDTVALPRAVAEERLSSLQLETVCFAARRFRQTLPGDRAAGYMLGDGTGCGKGRVIAACVNHMWNCGHRRSVWVSATADLYYDACRDLQDLGADIPCVSMRKLPPSGPLDKKGTEAHKELVKALGVECNGVIFLTYSLLVQTGQRRHVFPVKVPDEESRKRFLGDLDPTTLRCVEGIKEFGLAEAPAELKKGDRVVGLQSLQQLREQSVPFTVSFERVLSGGEGKSPEGNQQEGSELTPWNSRLGQLVAWLGGAEAGGLICYDEVHKAKNLVPDKDDSASTKTGLFVDLLQMYCPKAPVLYVSATAATEVSHLGYMSRLGIWGPGTGFSDFNDFLKVISSNGVAAMEMFAMNMKALGALSCRSLAYVGTEFQTQQNGLTIAQTNAYNAAARFWQKVLEKYGAFAEGKALRHAYKQKFFHNKMGEEEIGKRLWQFYWGAQQRFFKAMCNAAKVPAACAAAREALARGEQVVMSIWATGEARSSARMAKLTEETAGRVTIDAITDGGLVQIDILEAATLKKVAEKLYANLRLRSDIAIGGRQVPKTSRLRDVHGRRIAKPEDLLGASLPARLTFQASSFRCMVVEATTVASNEKVIFELRSDDLGERVIIGKVLEGPASFRRGEMEKWHVKRIGTRPVGKLRLQNLRGRLKEGKVISFHDPVLPDHLSGPQMILEHFINSVFLTTDENGEELHWAAAVKADLLEELRTLSLPANAMDEILDNLGGSQKVAELSGRSHRMKRQKDGTLAYVARCEELKCSADGANMVEQIFFQKGVKKVCMVTEVASAGISLHADRRQVRKDFQPPRRTMISVELPWGADKAIQVFGRVHRANQLVPPRFIMLTTPLGGEVRFISAIARRMKLLGAVTKGDRMTSMGGGADRHMADFDVNNSYGVRALETLFRDTTKKSADEVPDLIELYQGLSFIGEEGDGEATGRWSEWKHFAEEARDIWDRLHLLQEMAVMIENKQQGPVESAAGTKESPEINRFFNRILMLEVDTQNAFFEAFFAIYTELVRIDCANGVYDDGVDNLNQFQGRKIREIKVASKEDLYVDPVSGAHTQHVRLQLDRGISWEAAKEAYDALPTGGVEGFYAFRRKPDADPVYILVKERLQAGGAGSSGSTWVTRRRKRQYVVWRADSGTRSGLDFGFQAYSAADFSEDERYERIHIEGDSGALDIVQEGWTALYAASADARLEYEDVLTGNVLTAWRIVRGTSRGKEDPKLKLVRAVIQPDSVPLVGMKVAEEDLPKLKYVLECKREADQAKKMDGDSPEGSRGVALMVSEALLGRLAVATDEDFKLPYSSWLDVHKVLSAENAVLRSVDGLRGTQMALDLLAKKKLVEVGENGIALNEAYKGEKMLTGEKLEAKLFPADFCGNSDEEGGGSQGYADDSEEGDDVEFDNLLEKIDAGGFSTSEDEVAQEAPPKRGKKRATAEEEGVASVSTPAKAWKSKGAEQEGAADTSQPKSKAKKKKRHRSRNAASKLGGGDEVMDMDDDAMYEELFGADSEEEEQAPKATASPAGAGASTCPAKNDAMAEELFGDFVGEEAEGATTTAPAEPTKRRGKRHKHGHRAEPPPAASVAAAAAAAAAGPPEKGSWTYEVTGGKSLGIRHAPDVKIGEPACYLKEGEYFIVTERVQGSDGRVYLRLADGRGWAYDRSAKDFTRVVVKELVANVASGEQMAEEEEEEADDELAAGLLTQGV